MSNIHLVRVQISTLPTMTRTKEKDTVLCNQSVKVMKTTESIWNESWTDRVYRAGSVR